MSYYDVLINHEIHTTLHVEAESEEAAKAEALKIATETIESNGPIVDIGTDRDYIPWVIGYGDEVKADSAWLSEFQED